MKNCRNIFIKRTKKTIKMSFFAPFQTNILSKYYIDAYNDIYSSRCVTLLLIVSVKKRDKTSFAGVLCNDLCLFVIQQHFYSNTVEAHFVSSASCNSKWNIIEHISSEIIFRIIIRDKTYVLVG